MINTTDRQAFSDVSIIIKMMPNDMRQRIKPDFIKFVEENKDKDYVSNINENIPLEEQTLNENTKLLLALIYRDFLCAESEREELLKKEKIEIEERENEKREKYAVNLEDRKNNKDIKEEQAIISYKKESFIKKMFNKIKEVLNKKNN